jgi:hypothetical protein
MARRREPPSCPPASSPPSRVGAHPGRSLLPGSSKTGVRSRSLAGVGVLLALAVLGLLVVCAARPGPGLAAPLAMPYPASAGGAASAATDTTTSTVFLPLIRRPEPILPNVWQGEYFSNALLSGDPQYTTQEVRVDYDWGDGGAPPGLPADHFSIRWTGHWDFEVGQYTLFVYADDGLRLWLDDVPLVDAWAPGIGFYQAPVQIETAGLHRLKLEYFEHTGGAAIRLHWRRTDLYPQWHGDYYAQPWVEHGWLYDQIDSTIQFDWGEGCPHDLPCDGFSVAWNANPLFEPGTHRIYLYADEGYQLLVDGSLVREGGWYDGQEGGSQDVSYVLEAAGVERHHVTFNFHDRGTLAEARLWIVYMERPEWKAEYFDNKNLEGPPLLVKFVDNVSRDWGFGKPRSELPSADGFSVRWSGQRYFHSGCYRPGLFADDGVRLWVDGELLVDQWHDGRAGYYGPVTFLSAGYHDVTIEYYENIGESEIRVWWE